MLNQHTKLLAFACCLCLVNGDWGTKETSELRGRWQKQPINITGTLVTYNGETYQVENISLNRQIKQIKCFSLPGEKLFSISSEKPSQRLISKEPSKYLDTTNIDLVEVKKIETPYPDITWIYQEEPGKGRKLEFIQVDITLTDDSKSSYLLESHIKLYCDRLAHAAGPQEKDVPLAAIKELTISCFSKRLEEAPKKVEESRECPMPTPSTTIQKEEKKPSAPAA